MVLHPSEGLGPGCCRGSCLLARLPQVQVQGQLEHSVLTPKSPKSAPRLLCSLRRAASRGETVMKNTIESVCDDSAEGMSGPQLGAVLTRHPPPLNNQLRLGGMFAASRRLSYVPLSSAQACGGSSHAPQPA